MKKSSKVTAIIAVYNGEKYLAGAIESLLAQSPFEILVIDDGSQDQTATIAKRYPIHYIYQTNQGQPAAQNFALGLARGDYITFLDADDLHTPDKLAIQVPFLDENPHIDIVFGHVEQFISPEAPQKWLCPPGTTPGYVPAAGLFRKSCFERVGPFNEQQHIGVFVEWYMRAQEKQLTHALIPDKVLLRRIHGANMGAQQNLHPYLQVIKAALHRRGAV